MSTFNAELRDKTRKAFHAQGKFKAVKRDGLNYMLPLFTFGEFVAKAIELAGVKYNPKNPPLREDGKPKSEADWLNDISTSLANGLLDDRNSQFLRYTEFRTDDGNIVGAEQFAKDSELSLKAKTLVAALIGSGKLANALKGRRKLKDGTEQLIDVPHVFELPTGCKDGRKGRQRKPVDCFFDDVEFVDETATAETVEAPTETPTAKRSRK